MLSPSRLCPAPEASACRGVLFPCVAMVAVVLSVAAAALPAQHAAPIHAMPVVDRQYTPAVIDLISAADSTIHLMLYQARFYGEYPDSDSNRLLQALEGAADRSVHIEAIIDESSWRQAAENQHNIDFAQRMMAAGATVRFDPLELLSHQKVIVVDRRITVISSHNWTHYSLSSNNEAAVFVDDPIFAGEVLEYFAERNAQARDMAPTAPSLTDVTSAATTMVGADGQQRRGGLAEWAAEQPWVPVAEIHLAANRHYHPMTLGLIRASTQRIDVLQNTIEIMSEVPPYARPDRDPSLPPSLVNTLVDGLCEAAANGSAVRVVLNWWDRDNSKNIRAAHRLADCGVTVFYDSGDKTTHAKMLVVDARFSIVGSTNWTFNAVEQGNEISVVIDSPELAAAYIAYIDNVAAGGRPARDSSRAIQPLTSGN